MQSKFVVALGFATTLICSPLRAATIEHTDFISTPQYFNGFESISNFGYPANVPYSEGGITVTYVGAAGITTGLFSPNGSNDFEGGFQGTKAWYPNGGGIGYTDIKLTNGRNIDSLQFLADSGAFMGDLQYQLLSNGTVTQTGTTTFIPNSTSYIGFSGGGFDEVRVQNIYTGDQSAFNPLAREALAIDSVAAVSAVPLPASAPMFGAALLGLAGLGYAAKRKKAAASA